MKYLKYLYHGSILTLVVYNTWGILKLNATVNAIVAFLTQGM